MADPQMWHAHFEGNRTAVCGAELPNPPRDWEKRGPEDFACLACLVKLMETVNSRKYYANSTQYVYLNQLPPVV